MTGLDPQLVAPQAGDYRVASGSPAAGYGCRVFAPAGFRAVAEATASPPPGLRRRSVIDVAGSISMDAVWDAELVRVWGDVTVEPGVTLAIAPGARIEFQHYDRLTVLGRLLATGTPIERIVFTTDEPAEFRPDASRTGCWNGLRFIETSSLNAPSRLAFCVFEYSKALAGDAAPYAFGGGALSVVGFAKLSVEQCDFRRCVGEQGGAIFLYRGADILLSGSLIHDNHALGNAGAVYCAYSCPRLVNNTIVQNSIHNGDDPYIDTCAVLSFVSKPQLASNIIRDNEPEVVHIHTQVWNNKLHYTRCNDIAGHPATGGNIDADPRFLDPGDWDFRVASTSPCVDAGDAAAAAPVLADFAGVRRVSRGVVDIGAHETLFGDLDCNARVDFFDIDPLVLALSDPGGYAAAYPLCDALLGDLSADGAVDLLDIDPFVAALAGLR